MDSLCSTFGVSFDIINNFLGIHNGIIAGSSALYVYSNNSFPNPTKKPETIDVFLPKQIMEIDEKYLEHFFKKDGAEIKSVSNKEEKTAVFEKIFKLTFSNGKVNIVLLNLTNALDVLAYFNLSLSCIAYLPTRTFKFFDKYERLKRYTDEQKGFVCFQDDKTLLMKQKYIERGYTIFDSYECILKSDDMDVDYEEKNVKNN